MSRRKIREELNVDIIAHSIAKLKHDLNCSFI